MDCITRRLSSESFACKLPSLPPAARKVLLWGVGFFTILNMVALGSSFFVAGPSSLKQLLRLGGGLGIGIGGVALAMLLRRPKGEVGYTITRFSRPYHRQTIHLPFTMQNIDDLGTKNWTEQVLPQLKKSKTWKGWMSFVFPNENDPRPISITWGDEEKRDPSYFYLPVSLIQESNDIVLALDKGTPQLAKDSQLTLEQVWNALRNRFQKENED